MGPLIQATVVGVIVIAIMIILDLITKLCTGLNAERNGFKFDWKKFLLFLKTGVAPYFGIWLGFSLVNILIVFVSENYATIEIPGFAGGTIAAIIYATAAAIALKIGNSIWENLKQLGVNPPKIE